MSEGSQVFCEQGDDLPEREAAKLADLILGRENLKLPVNIIFTGDKAIGELNLKYRKRPGPTDVLAFPADPELEILGDIYISVDTARRQAGEYGQSLMDEILRLVCHGTLHLCGYDHHQPDEETRMRGKEEHYLSEYTDGN